MCISELELEILFQSLDLRPQLIFVSLCLCIYIFLFLSAVLSCTISSEFEVLFFWGGVTFALSKTYEGEKTITQFSD